MVYIKKNQIKSECNKSRLDLIHKKCEKLRGDQVQEKRKMIKLKGQQQMQLEQLDQSQFEIITNIKPEYNNIQETLKEQQVQQVTTLNISQNQQQQRQLASCDMVKLIVITSAILSSKNPVQPACLEIFEGNEQDIFLQMLHIKSSNFIRLILQFKKQINLNKIIHLELLSFIYYWGLFN